MLFNLDPTTILIRALVLFTAMPIHECAHGWVADKLGDHTARSQGRLTLNPFHHLDPFGSVLLLLAGFGWAKPVPVNPYYFTKVKKKTGVALTALAGPDRVRVTPLGGERFRFDCAPEDYRTMALCHRICIYVYPRHTMMVAEFSIVMNSPCLELARQLDPIFIAAAFSSETQITDPIHVEIVNSVI